MHCSFYGTDTLPMWSINSANYTSLSLPPNHKYNGRILTVDNVYIAQNGSTYQCFFDLSFSNGTFYQLSSNIGRLNILTSGKFGLFFFNCAHLLRNVYRCLCSAYGSY